MILGFSFLAILVYVNQIDAEVTAKQYASMPDLFLQDNYDNCMMRGDEAFYCSFYYLLEPINKENPSEIWSIIKNVSDVRTNYRHDHLRRWICVPKICPGINKTHETDPQLKRELENCYDKEFEKMGLKGTISQLRCETNEPKYPVDWVDILTGIVAVSYILFVFCATVYEGIARYKPPEEYEKLTSTRTGKILSACSITRNWIRLKTINSTPEIEKLRSIQGIRVYNMGLVILSHTLLGIIALPVANTRYTETMHEKHPTLFFSSGPLCVATFFFISSFLLSNGIFDYMKKKPMNLKTVLFIFAKRLFRLTPSVFVVVLFHATFFRHLGNGPNWNHFVHSEFIKCRINGWTNLLYINNWVNYSNMCLLVTWYLALDTQYFLLSLFFIWLIKSYEKHVWSIIGSAVVLNIVGTFCQNYYHDFTALVLPTAEMYYGMVNPSISKQFHYQTCGFIGNTAGPLVGIAFGYYFSTHKNDEKLLFNSKFRQTVWWLFSLVLLFSFVIITGLIILRESAEHNAIWASAYVATARIIHCFAIGLLVLGFSEGTGWLALRVCQWAPTYVLGRLTFSAYLVHLWIILIRPALVRFPIHVTGFQLSVAFFGDLFISYIVAAFLTLFVELPVSELQKYIFGEKGIKNDTDTKIDKDK